jgi:hypothetical protein
MSCFAQLRDDVPTWISDANQLSVHVHAKRAEFAAESSELASRRQKSNDSVSNASLRRKPLRQGLKRILSRESLSEAVKRRKVEDVSSIIDEPAPEKPELVISYDAHTQKVLEKLVRQIWSAKSNIRSARIAQSMRSVFKDRLRLRLPSYNHDDDPKLVEAIQVEVDEDATFDEDTQEEFKPLQKMPSRKGSPFDFIECQLDAAQNLCESGAYRFLREGNCLDELEGLVRAFEMILEASTTMTEQMEAAERQRKEEEEPAAKAEKEQEDAPEPDMRNPLRDGAGDSDELNATVLEVDDRSDKSEVSIDISAFRLTRYGHRTLHPFTIARPVM